MAPVSVLAMRSSRPRQLGAHRRLIAQARRHLPHQAGHLHAGLDETKNVIDEQQHVAMLVVPEILGHRQRRLAHAEPAARRLVHLAEHHHHVRQHAGFLHVAVKLLPFAAAFADAAKNAHALLMPDHVVDHFGEQHRLAHARPAEQSRLAAALQRHEHVDDLDARFKDLGLGGTPRQGRRSPMDGAPLDIGRRRLAVDGVAEHVEHSRENSFADRRLQRPARVLHRHAASETLRGSQRDPAHVMRIELRQHFDDDLALPLPRAAASRSAANAHRTAHPRRCRAPRPPRRIRLPFLPTGIDLRRFWLKSVIRGQSRLKPLRFARPLPSTRRRRHDQQDYRKSRRMTRSIIVDFAV